MIIAPLWLILSPPPPAQDDEPEDEWRHRAISDHWTFRKRNKKWSRRSRPTVQEDSFSSSIEDILSEEREQDTKFLSSPLLLVTELRKSLTGLDRCVKTYSFLPNEEQVPKIIVESDTVSDVFTIERQEVSGDEGLGTDEFSEYDPATTHTFPRGGMDSFATDVFSTFESNLVRSQSLPDIFSNLALDLSEHSDEDVSSASSVLDSSKDSILDESPVPLSLPPTPNQEQLTPLGSHRKENSLSSEAYESAESSSRPETPNSPPPQKRAKTLLSEKWSTSSVSSVRKSTASLRWVALLYSSMYSSQCRLLYCIVAWCYQSVLLLLSSIIIVT